MLTTIDQHISSLLYYHDIVVVPEFGAFITRHFSAEVNNATHMLRPPSKRVAFNVRIKDNDGALAKYISKSENVSYNQALESISISVRSWERVLRAGKKVNLNGIGKLFLDEEGNVQFNPSIELNYEIKAYGLSIFRTEAIKRSAYSNNVVHTAVNEKVSKEAPKAKKVRPAKAEKKKRRTGNVRWAAVLIPIAALGIIGYSFQNEIEDQVGNFASLNPMSVLMVGSKSIDEEPKNEEEKTIHYEEAVDKKETAQVEAIAEDEPKKIVSAPKEKTDKPVVKPTVHQAKSLIVVGAFGSRSSAEKYANTVANKGFKTEIRKHDTKNLLRVVIVSPKEEASSLAEIKNRVNPQAWVLN